MRKLQKVVNGELFARTEGNVAMGILKIIQKDRKKTFLSLVADMKKEAEEDGVDFESFEGVCEVLTFSLRVYAKARRPR